MEQTKLTGKALITGASGFIGGRLRDVLQKQGVDVLAIRRAGSPPAKNCRSVEASYDRVEELERVIRDEKPDYVFHVAGVTKGVSYDDFRHGNVTPTRNLLAAVERAHPDIKRFVHFSSLAAYGPSTPNRPLDENVPRLPIEHYGRSKLEAEEAVENARSIPWTIVRPSGVYGPGDVDYFNLFREVNRGRNVFFGNRDRWFSAIYVDDLLDATLLATASDAAVQKGYFVSDGHPITWGEFQAAIVDSAGRRVRTLHLPESLVSLAALGGELVTKIDGKPRLFNRQKAIMGAQSAWTCSSDALMRDVSFKPAVDYREGCKRTYAWYAEQGWF